MSNLSAQSKNALNATDKQIYNNMKDILASSNSVLGLEALRQTYDASMNIYRTLVKTYETDLTAAGSSNSFALLCVGKDGNAYYKSHPDASGSGTSKAAPANTSPGYDWVKMNTKVGTQSIATNKFLSITKNSDGSTFVVYYTSSTVGTGATNTLVDGVNISLIPSITKAAKTPSATAPKILALIGGVLKGGNYTSGASVTSVGLTSSTTYPTGATTMLDFCLRGTTTALFAVFSGKPGIYLCSNSCESIHGGTWTLITNSTTSPTTKQWASVFVGMNSKTYVTDTSGTVYYNTLTATNTFTSSIWEKLPGTNNNIAKLTYLYPGLNSTVYPDYNAIQAMNTQLTHQIELMKKYVVDNKTNFSNEFIDEISTNNQLNLDYTQLLADKKFIDNLLDEYRTSDQIQQEGVLTIERDNMLFRIFFVIFVLILIYIVRSMIQRGNDMNPMSQMNPMNNYSPVGDKMLYLVSFVLLLFAMNFFKSTFGFFLMCIMVMVAVFIMTGIYSF